MAEVFRGPRIVPQLPEESTSFLHPYVILKAEHPRVQRAPAQAVEEVVGHLRGALTLGPVVVRPDLALGVDGPRVGGGV
eukprot:9973810-Alexandrium_andersonii.AAC.1